MSEAVETERWESLPVHPKYQVSTLGKVRGRTAKNGLLLPEGEWRVLGLSKDNKGYKKASVDGRVRLVRELV